MHYSLALYPFQPLYVAGPHDSNAKIHRIIHTLTQHLGEDGFEYRLPLHVLDDLDEFEAFEQCTECAEEVEMDKEQESNA